MPRELDFLQEADNAERVRHMFRGFNFLEVPKIHYEYSSPQVLTMEFCEGAQINDVKWLEENKIDLHEVCYLRILFHNNHIYDIFLQLCKYIGKLYAHMIFKCGYVHAGLSD